MERIVIISIYYTTSYHTWLIVSFHTVFYLYMINLFFKACFSQKDIIIMIV